MPETKILIADDELLVLETLSEVLSEAGFKVLTASDGSEAQKKLSDDIAVAILDLNMPGFTGIECASYAKRKFPSMQSIIISGCDDTKMVVKAMKQGVFWYLTKPWDNKELIGLVKRAADMYELQEENLQLKRAHYAPETPAVLLGHSPKTMDLLRRAAAIAELDSTVLLTGESGTGKSTLARFIHQKSKRAKHPFVAISCAAMPRDLLEAELFGHERGAFTGAVSRRIGSIEAAEGGTLFLDEVGDLSLDLQPKLLTFLQDHVLRRIGGEKTWQADVRVITATNRDLGKMVASHEFREDLYYRLNVIPLDSIPLRERSEDILPLAHYYLDDIALRRGVSMYSLTKDASAKLLSHSWPGNIRELANILERATIFSKSLTIDIQHLDISIKQTNIIEGQELESFSGCTLEEMERKLITATLEACRGSKAAAARMLGIGRKTIYNKIKKYGIEEDSLKIKGDGHI